MLNWVQRVFARWEQTVGPPTEFKGEISEIRARLVVEDPQRAREVLNEAQARWTSANERAEGAERRATTLQGAASIAASLALAGGSLLLDPTKIHGTGWKAAVAVLFVSAIYCLVAAAYRAAQASSQVHNWHEPRGEDIYTRAGADSVNSDLDLAADYLFCYGRNSKIAAWKVAYMRAAAEWFARALIIVLLVAAALGLYALAGPSEPQHSQECRTCGLYVDVAR